MKLIKAKIMSANKGPVFLAVIFTMLIPLCYSENSYAQYVFGTRSIGLGGAGRAAQIGSEGPLLNPANFPLNNDFHFGGIFNERELDSQGFVTEFGGFIVDRNPEALFPAMLSYTKKDKRLDGLRIKETNYEVAVGKPVTGWLAIGFDLRYFQQRIGSDENTYFNGGLGALVNPAQNLTFAVVGRNILNRYTLDMQPALDVAGAYMFEKVLSVMADGVFREKDNPDKKGVYSLGLESYLPYDFMVRLGGRKDEYLSQNFWTAGLGWDGPKFTLNYAYERNASKDGQFAHSFDLLVYF
ncbi:MAG: hypothetical protein KDD25_07215 [Bdellovibrionales bacterium]|nr:hypothetical protein [Bdellovibrionales bacterium]